MKIARYILPTIVIAQFCCTSLWFASNGILTELIAHFQLTDDSLGSLTSAVQFGFIIGTLGFALLTIADRFSPSKVFMLCAMLGALANGLIIWNGNNMDTILFLRFMTGFFLAGIYPIGMKIASDYFDNNLGKSLGFLVGALVIGTAFPHLFKGISRDIPWQYVIITTSCLATLGGIAMGLFVADGPYRKPGQKVDLSVSYTVFKNKSFRAAAFGYFGHMWELYAFWTFVPLILKGYNNHHPEASLNVPLWSFLIIGLGGIACILAGIISRTVEIKKVATLSLLLSCVCCLLSPIFFELSNTAIFVGLMVFWGMVVIADSPMFSTMVAQSANAENKGTALTIVTCIGFGLTIVSIKLLSSVSDFLSEQYIYITLAIGPILGLIALLNLKNNEPSHH